MEISNKKVSFRHQLVLSYLLDGCLLWNVNVGSHSVLLFAFVIFNREISKGVSRFRELLRAVETRAVQGLRQVGYIYMYHYRDVNEEISFC